MQDFGFVTERNFYCSCHGKGPSDGAGAVIKSVARRAVNSQMEVITQKIWLCLLKERLQRMMNKMDKGTLIENEQYFMCSLVT